MKRTIKTYSELIQIPTFEERFEYLKEPGVVCGITFGHLRYLNQKFYSTDREWLAIRDAIIIRDKGCDMAHKDYSIVGPVIIHHINPITSDDILNRTARLLSPENLICVSDRTHKAIHYGNKDQLPTGPIVRRANDMCPWKK